MAAWVTSCVPPVPADRKRCRCGVRVTIFQAAAVAPADVVAFGSRKQLEVAIVDRYVDRYASGWMEMAVW